MTALHQGGVDVRRARYQFRLLELKLREADFFLEKFRTADDVDQGSYTLSAFLSAARSATFALRKTLRGLAGPDPWSTDWHAELKTHPMANYLHTFRNKPIQDCWKPLPVYGDRDENIFIVEWKFTLDRDAPERNAVTIGKSYLTTLIRIAGEAYERYWTNLDLPDPCSPDDLAARGQTMEDIEEDLDYPRLWTGGLPLDERIAMMKEHVGRDWARLRERYLMSSILNS